MCHMCNIMKLVVKIECEWHEKTYRRQIGVGGWDGYSPRTCGKVKILLFNWYTDLSISQNREPVCPGGKEKTKTYEYMQSALSNTKNKAAY